MSVTLHLSLLIMKVYHFSMAILFVITRQEAGFGQELYPIHYLFASIQSGKTIDFQAVAKM
jgi:hypothetical protein